MENTILAYMKQIISTVPKHCNNYMDTHTDSFIIIIL